MKKRIFILALIALISGCKKEMGGNFWFDENVNNDPDPVNLPSYPFNFDAETPGGIMLELGQNNHPPFEDMDIWYAEAQQCVADWYAVLYPSRSFDFVDPPPVILQNGNIDGFCGTDGMTGKYCTNYLIPFVVLETGWAQFAYKWKHEFIHHILFMNDFSNTLNFNHQHITDIPV